MVYRAYVEKKKGLDNEARSLRNELVSLLGIASLENVRILNRYDVEKIEKELFDYSKGTVLSEPQLDDITETPNLECDRLFAVEILPGQFDQRANSCAECIQIISKGERPIVRSAKVYCLYGNISDDEFAQIKKYVINPVEAREASLEEYETLVTEYDIPETVRTLDGFIGLDREGLAAFVSEYGLAMDTDDIAFCQEYFKSEHRDPTITEIRMIDTYWSDHCRHTTFLTEIDSVKFEDELLARTYDDYIATRAALGRTKPICLMDVATLAVKYLRENGKLDKLDESEEINACTVKINIEVDGEEDVYLLHYKIDNVERRINDELGILCTIHMDPIITNDETVNELREFTRRKVKAVVPEADIHDFRTVVGVTHTNLIFDIVLPFENKSEITEIRKNIEAEIQKERKDCFCVITVDRA